MPSYVHPMPRPLQPYVQSCVGYDYFLAPDATHHGLPSTALTVIIAFDEPIDCGWLDGGPPSLFPTLLGGLHTRPTLIHTHGRQCGIQLSVTPAGSRALFDTPAGVFAGEILDETHGLPAAVQRRLQDASWSERFRLLDDALLARLARLDAHPMRREVAHAWARVHESAGRVRVEELADEVGLSRRRLLTEFRTEIGLTPSQARRIARFDRARDLLKAGHSPADSAALAGYADQPHLNRDWRALADMTPLETLADFAVIEGPEDDPFVQDAIL